MFFKSKTPSLVLLGITSLVCSRAMFSFFNDPEGPNLLIVVGMAGILYAVSIAVYLHSSSPVNLKRLLLAILIQILVVIGLYLFLR